MSSERLIPKGSVKSLHGSQSRRSSSFCHEGIRIFDELPKATILSVSRPDVSDIGPLLLSYTIQIEYKQFKWCLLKKASQVIYLHFALKKRAIVEEIHEKQGQVKDWLQHIGIGDQTTVVHDNDEPDDGAIPVHNEDSIKKRSVPTRAALSIIRPSIGRSTVSEKAKVAMQNYLNHFLGNIDIVNSREVCQFLEVSKLSFSSEYGPKLKEDYVSVQHLNYIQRDDADVGCLMCCCRNNWQKVWAVLKPGFLALLEDPFGTKLLDIIVFDVLPPLDGDQKYQVLLAEEVKERNPLRYAFKVTCGNRSTKIRTTSSAKVNDWISAIYNASQKPIEGWCNPHRFGSFAPQRGLTDDGSQAQWFVDGQVAFEAIAMSISNAKSEIYVTGWWLCPELYLKRPFHANGASRLDALFEAKAKEGVKIYILLYKEVAIALKINSLYSQKRLLQIHENVKVLRYPDHFAAGIYLWSHHEKIVVVDHQICFLGGLDLCFGRYDTIEHKVSDHPPFIWPGKDYYNPRESEPNSWVDTMTDELDRRKYPRMPWHDVHCAIWGPPVRDVARHFVQRWNHAKRNKAPNEQTIPLLMPQQHMVLPHYMGISQNINIEGKTTDGNQISITPDKFSYESSLSQDIQFLLPQEADGMYSKNVNNKLNGLHLSNHLDQSHDEQLSHAMQTADSADDFDFLDHRSENSTGTTDFGSDMSDEGCETQEVPRSGISQVGPRTSCSCQVIRSVCPWSGGTSQTEDSIHKAYCSLIENAEKFIYIENQFFISGLSDDDVIQNRVLEALYRRILRAHKEEKCFRVIIVIPLLPGFQGRLDDGGAATVRAIMHWQYRTISRGHNSILHNLNALLGSKTNDYISFYGLRTYGRLGVDGPIATSQVYVHSKVMIVDDRITLIGSSNINDRSLLGHRDSEIGVLIEDREFIESTMNGESWSAGKFANSLRLSLWSEHLGLHGEEISWIRDPIADSTYKDMWLATAMENSQIYQDVFSCIPNDSIHSRYAFRQSMNSWKERFGHTTIDLGVAPEKLTDGNIPTMEILKRVRGFLVSFPLQFMCHEDLRPMFSETEFYASPQVFY